MDQFDRRAFLRIGGLGVIGVTFAPLLNACGDNPVSPPGAEGFAPFITPNDEFFLQFGGQDTIAAWAMPSLDREGWRLKIEGEVPTPLTLGWNDIAELAAMGHERTLLKTMQCILDSPLSSGPTGLVGNAWWTGIPLRLLLERAGMDAENTKRLNFTGADGFINNVKSARVSGGDQGSMEILLAYRMNGQDLTREHGGPVRLIIPEMYGFKNIKWLTLVEASPFDRAVGQYQREGFVDDGVIRVNSRSENVKGSITVPAGPVEVTGYALSGYEGIEAVQISIDGGAWQAAGIEPRERVFDGAGIPPSVQQVLSSVQWPYPAVWAKWRFRWEASQGDHSVAVRAADRSGRTQPAEDLDISDGQTGIVRYSVRVS